jgi:small nuclear ribonucleoprotein (snRNP)-like protein
MVDTKEKGNGRKMANVGRTMFFGELSRLLRKQITVVTKEGKAYTGVFDGYNPETMSICLTDAADDKGNAINKVFLNGNTVTQIFTTEKPFDMRALADRLEKVFPRMVRFYEDVGVIVVMEKIRVNETGILEGTGPIAERVQRVYDQFTRRGGRS